MGLPGMREPAHQAPVDPELLRAMRQADVSSGFEQLMISCANASVVFLVVVVLFFTLLSKMPERAPSMKPPVGAAAQGKQAAGRGKDGRYTAAEVAQHASEVRRSAGAASRPSAPTRAFERAFLFTLTDAPRPRCQRDLWIIVKGKVYDVTSYVEEHPGGDAILRNAGCVWGARRSPSRSPLLLLRTPAAEHPPVPQARLHQGLPRAAAPDARV
jgi:hypothetical protein